MGVDTGRYRTELLPLRVESGKLVTPASVAGRIENFETTPEGTLVSVRGPAPYVPDYGAGFPAYGNMHGVFHALLIGGVRDVLLVQSGAEVWVQQGWNQATAVGSAGSWDRLIGAPGTMAQVIQELPDHVGPQFPCQFESTGTGIVIVPQGGRAVFYDGIVALPLGYERAPDAPKPQGPESSGTTNPTVNDTGYEVRRIVTAGGVPLPETFGYGRLGTVQSQMGGSNESGVLRGRWQGALQWIDHFGNLSPLSQRSASLHVAQQAHAAAADVPETLTFEFAWENLENGPTGTVGKVLCRTKDLVNSGTSDLFEVPPNIGAGGLSSFATIPDNVSRVFPDNIPDVWLVTRPPEPIPVPQFKLCRLALGRLWIANTRDDPGLLIPSMPGRWGTFLKGTEMFPDPQGGEITGLWAISSRGGGALEGGGGLLACTASSTFVVVQTEAGLVSVPLHPSVGCAAPSSFANMPDGSVVWLARDGFYRYDGQEIAFISEAVRPLVERLNPGRLLQACAAYDPRSREYRCWVPLDGSRENTLCLAWDGEGWRRRTDVQARAVCVTRDHRQYMIVAGRSTNTLPATTDGVWVLDREVQSYTPQARESRLETGWIEGVRSMERKSPKTLYLWLRESDDGTATVELFRDWSMVAAISTDTAQAELDKPESGPPMWGVTSYGGATPPNQWMRRRPYWKRVHIDAPSAEVYKLVIRSANRIELLGVRFDEQPQGTSGRVP